MGSRADGPAALLGLNAFHGDASAVLLDGGKLVVGVEEERFTRVKHWAGFPVHALEFCLRAAPRDGPLVVAVSRQPRAHLWRKVALALRHPRGLARFAGRARNLAAVSSLQGRLQALAGARTPIRVVPVEHHLAHAASAFFCSPFEEAACLTVDGFGDFSSSLLAVGRGERIEVLQRVYFPHSLGLFYTGLTQYLGFPSYGDEYKVMGLAAYGEPRYAPLLRGLVPAMDDGTFRLDLDYFAHLRDGVDMTWSDGEPRLGDVFTPALEALLGPRRRADEELQDRHKDLAASVQAVYEERFFVLVRSLLARTRARRLCLAGGCAMNSLANGRLLDHADLDELYIPPAAGDAGTALGAALYHHHAELGHPRRFVMDHAYWGPEYGQGEIQTALAEGIAGSRGEDGTYGHFRIETISDESRLCADTAAALAAGEVVGWYQGRSEWGPRALGNRSILADPRRADMREILNLKIKRREPFRPFAPSVLAEETGAWFTHAAPDPFMARVYPVRAEKRAAIPAVTHADGTGRLQTVTDDGNPRFARLLRAFHACTGVPILLNTSFNENEPIVNTPQEALHCFLRTRMDRLVLGHTVVRRRPPAARPL